MPDGCLAAASLLLALIACEPQGEKAGAPNVRDSASEGVGASAQSPSQSDTMHIYIHNVRPGKEAEYERWVGEVWMPSVEKAGQKYPEVREATKGQRLFAHTAKEKDGSARYVWLFEPAPPSTEATANWSFPDSFLVAGGYSPRDAAAQAKALWALTTAEGGEVVRKF